MIVSAHSATKSFGGSMHGDKLAVEYQVLNTGSHILLIKEKIGTRLGKAKFKTLKTIDLSLKGEESLSMYNGYFCFDPQKIEIYGIVENSKSKVRSLRPVRAWRVDRSALDLTPVVDLSKIFCTYEEVH